MARILVQLKLRLLLNALRSSAAAKTSFIVSSVFALILAVATFAGLAALRHNGAAVDLTAALYTTFAFGWLILPLLAFGLDSTLDPATLALYPLRTRPLMTGLLAASVTGVWPLANLIGELGITVGLAHGALAVVIAVVATVLQVLFCITLARWVTTALAGLLRSRRGRDLAALAIIPIFGLYEIFAQVVPKAIGQHHLTAASFAGVDAWLRWLPPGLAAHAVQDASTGHAGLAVAQLALLLGIIGVLAALWGRSLSRALVTTDTSTQASAVRSGALPFATGLLTRRDSLTSTIAARVWVYQRRDPTSMIYWGITSVVMVAVSIGSLRSHHSIVGVLISAGFGGAIIGALHGNVIALTGPPFYLDALALPGRKAMRAWFAGHDIVFAGLGVPLILVVSMAIAIISGHPANGFLAWALGLAAIGAALGLSNFCSAVFPWPAVKRPGTPTPRPADGFGGQNAASRIGTLLGTGILVLPVIIVTTATGSVSDTIRMPVLIAGGAAYGALLAWAGATIAGIIAQATLPDLFQLASRTELLSPAASDHAASRRTMRPHAMKVSEWSGDGWTVSVTGAGMTLTHAPGSVVIASADAARLEVRRRWFRWSLFNDGQPLVGLRGITRTEAAALSRAVRRLALAPVIADALAWHAAVAQVLAEARTEQRWIPAETASQLAATRPGSRLLDRVRAAGCEPSLTAGQLEAAAFLDADLDAVIAHANEQIMASELSSRRSFFDTIEKTPLTDEQARAVVCFDNRVQVLAAAGSGKTSVMVARAAYAVSRGFVTPDRILLLAFNKAAAAELQERVEARFAAAGIDSSGLRAATFHSFGLEVIGRATGAKPRLARWLDQGEDAAMVLRIADELRDASESFRHHWDLYRLLFANVPADLAENEPDGYDHATRRAGYRTFAGEVVKSHSERMIANFLYLNGVDYVYERPYDVDVSDSTHSQYRPDFFYPGVDVWHEHWALGRDGKPPPEFEGYAESMAWKRQVHAQHGTRLLESTWAEVMFGDGLARLENELTRLGLTLDWNPDRPVSDGRARPMKHEDLARLVRTFMTHVKSNSWTPADLERRLAGGLARLDGYRTRLFLQLYWPIHDQWQKRLAADRSVDFEDMLVQAAGHLEAGTVDAGFDLIMVDEFQDASRARACLVRGLVQSPGRFLMAVGDDWQSINRFAGADLSVMTDFEALFGRGRQLALTTTFRCPQTVCDVARVFVSANPGQYSKPMRSAHPDPGPPITVIQAVDPAGALARYLGDLSDAVAAGRVPAGRDGTVSVDVLGRYGFERDVLPRHPPANLHVTFRTVHGSKGLEADYVVIPGLTTGSHGFPSTITEDPVLDLAMPVPEAFPHAEERRLFYVALTRARRAAVLITDPRRMSPFVIELRARNLGRSRENQPQSGWRRAGARDQDK